MQKETPHSKTTAKPRHFDQSWEVACSILDYFDSYKLGSVAPIAATIEKAMDRANGELLADVRGYLMGGTWPSDKYGYVSPDVAIDDALKGVTR